MILTSIQVQGFKSFADKTVLKFGKGITAVVGPNGSGKSNISDAVRWVLGEQSTKNLRGQSMEDVIFGGTADRKPHGFCEVTLNIDNSDRELHFDNDSVAVTRRYYRSHDSEYLINGNVVRLRDIHELFMDTGLGRDGYSMIGQGKIDSIISSKSQERRDIFEEASGISRYRYRKTDAERKLAAAEDNLVRLLDILKELESRIGPLKDQSEKAEKFLLLAAEKKQLDIGVWLNIINNSKAVLQAHDDKIAIARAQYKEIDDKLTEFDLVNEKNSADFARFSAEIDDRHGRIAEYTENIAKLMGDISVCNNDILHNNETLERLKGEISDILSSKDEKASEIAAKQELVAAKNIEIESLNTAFRAKEKELSEMILKSEDISRKIEAEVVRLNDLSSRLADLRVSLMSSTAAVSEIENRTSTVDSQIAENEERANTLGEEYDGINKLITSIEEDITGYNNSLEGYRLRLKNRTDSVSEAKEELDKTRLDIEAKKRRIQILEDLEKNMEGFNHSVKTVMKDSDSGKLKGVHGPVTRLIKVSKEYSIAIETALGTAAQNIIVDSEGTAKYAIEMLKSSNSGRATFLPISSIKAREFNESGFEDEYGYVGIASDLVESDKKYNEIVKYLLGGTVVAEDIDSAVSIARKFKFRFKVVSLDGQVINAGGSLTGGSLIKNAGLLSRSGDILRLKDELTKLLEKEKRNTELFNNATLELSKVEGEVKSAEDLLKTANEDKIRALGELKRVGELLDSVKKTLAELTDEKTNAGEKINALKASASLQSAEIESLEAEKAALEAAVSEMNGGRDIMSTSRDELTTAITDIKLSIIEKNKDIENLNSAIALLNLDDSQSSGKINIIEAEIETYKAKNAEIDAKILEIEAVVAGLKTASLQFESDIVSFTERRNEIEKSGSELRASERELTNDREKISGELARLCERRENMSKECDDVIRQLFDEYQLTRSEAEERFVPVEDLTAAKKQLGEVKSKIRSLGNVNVSAIEEYKEVNERYTFMKEQLDDIEKSRTELGKLISQLTEQMKELFVVGFNSINENFSKTFTDLFGGGSAKLQFTDPDNVLESGIDIVVKLPGKNVPTLDGLSGGEKALIALAIYFAIMRVSAPPFCFLDEVDTALDDINVDRFADYMKSNDFNTQFICITHRRGTMEAADMLYGVTMQEKGISKLLELNVSSLEKMLKLEDR